MKSSEVDPRLKPEIFVKVTTKKQVILECQIHTIDDVAIQLKQFESLDEGDGVSHHWYFFPLDDLESITYIGDYDDYYKYKGWV